MLIIVQFTSTLSTANSFVPEFTKLKIAYEKTNLIDTRGDWQRKPPDYHRKNFCALKKGNKLYAELGVGYDFSVGYEQIYQKVDAQLVISYDERFLNRSFVPKRYVYDELGRIQLNDEYYKYYYEDGTYFRVLPISYSWYDHQIFIKKKLHDSDSSALTYQLGYIFQTKGSYFEDGIKKNSSAIVFNDPKMGSKRIGGHQINHELFIRKYLKLSSNRPKEYYDLDFKFVTDPDHKLLKAKVETGIGFDVTRNNLVELKVGFETKSFAIERDLLTARVTLYHKMSKYFWVKTEFLRKYSKGAHEFDDVKITSITTGIEVKF